MRRRSAGSLVGDLWVVRRGTGRPLVLLHGNGASHREFDRLVRRLAPGRSLIGIDSRAQGRSLRGDGPLTIARLADDVDEVLGSLGVPTADVLGHSDGGNIALELALRHPKRVRRIVISGANLDPSGLRPSLLRTFAVVRAACAPVAAWSPWARRRVELMDLMLLDPQIAPSDLGAVTAPVLVVVGERDVILPAHTRLIVSSLPDSRLVVMPGVGHMVPVRRPAELAALIEDFLGAPDSD